MKTYEERMQSVQRKLQRKQITRRAMMATAGALCLCIIAGIAFWPFSDRQQNITQYQGNEYYKVIEAINRAFPPKAENDDWIWIQDEEDLFFKDDLIYGAAPPLEEAAPNAPGSTPDIVAGTMGSADSSVEITDHQVAGVLEADIIKRSQTHIFYLKGNTLEVYPIAGLDTKLLSTWCIKTVDETFYYKVEMYLSEDASRINLILSGYGKVFRENKRSAFTQVISLDVTDPGNIKEANSLYITGSLISSRMVGDQMLLMVQYRMDTKVDFDDQSTFLPQIGMPDDMQSVPADQIVVPVELVDKAYTVVTLLDGKDMTVVDSGAFMSYSTELYVSKERIYATRSYMEDERISDEKTVRKAMTEISCMTYDKNGLETDGSFCVEGTVKNQYSMDEHEGIFRIVTGTNRQETVTKEIGDNGFSSVQLAAKRNANLTCFQVGTWEQLAQVEQFAPEGETVESVRFDGDYAYVCTAVVVTFTDPVFFFDMTDINNITVKDTGTIDGYSSSLIQLNDGFLLGIGFDENRCLKVEVYMETADGVEAVCAYTQWVSFASEYKAYYIDRENNLFGIPTNDGYILLQFDGYQLTEIARTKFLGVLNKIRGVVIDNYLYAFGTDGYTVQKIA